MKPTKALADRRKESGSNANVVASVEFVMRTELHDSVETDFVHSILGRIEAESESRGKEDAGHIGERCPVTETFLHFRPLTRLCLITASCPKTSCLAQKPAVLPKNPRIDAD
jgi:hypothetical protein